MEVLSPRSTNILPKSRTTMTDAKVEEKPKLQANNKTKDLPSPPPPIVPEPGPDGEVYETSHKLGQGGFACCYAGSLQRNSRVFALKIVKSKMQHRKMQEKVSTAPIYVAALSLICSLLPVSHRAPNTLQDATPQHRRILPRFSFR